jgi:SAM-dependent methyltransferase
MATVQQHYDSHLGAIYGWMIGDFETAKEAARAELQAVGISSGAGRIAIDLGAGPGAHAIVLADAGYAVTAMDTCAELLDEHRAHDHEGAVRRIQDDLLQMRRYCSGADVILCMGDTLTHLESTASVQGLFSEIGSTLTPGGVFVATFRDYASKTLEGLDRFIPVRQDDSRILTCFLEYSATSVTVHDLLHERTSAGWTLRVSSYPKLRLNPEWARAALERLGLAASLEAGPRGMTRLVARRPEVSSTAVR